MPPELHHAILHFFPTLSARPPITILINNASYLTLFHLPNQVVTCVLISNSFDILIFLAVIIENFDKKNLSKKIKINAGIISGSTVINNKMLG